MTFPTTSILDNFNRSNTGPPPSASWVTPAWAPAGLKVDTNQLASNASNYGCTAGYNTVYGPDCEFYVDITAGTVDTTQFEIYARSDTNQLDNYFTAGNGYGLQVTVASGGSGVGLYLFKFVNGVTEDLSPVAIENFDLAVGDSFGIQVIGTTIKAFYKPAAGAWTEKISRTDATFGSAGYTGLMINDADGRLDNFGGGTLDDCSTFPVRGILDDFNRANEGPQPSANWGLLYYSGMAVVSDHVMASDALRGGSYWSAATFGPDCEVYITVSDFKSHTDTNVYVFVRIQISGGSPVDGYGISITKAGHYIFYRIDTYSSLGEGNTSALSNGDSVGLSIVGSTLSLYIKPSAGSWTLIDTAIDSNVSGVGYIGINIDDVTGSGDPALNSTLDDFGGGSVYCAPAAPVAPTADFSGTPTSGAATLDVDFTDLSTGTPTSWLWDFGDGSTSTSQNPSHSYPFIGVYTVALTATNAIGDDTETKVDYIVVGVAPAADFSGTPTSGSAPLSVDFTDLSTGDVTDWLWDFGDGGSDVIPNATHIYAAAGTYTVALTVTGPAGTDTETKVDYITVTAPAAPVADFSGDTTSGPVPLTVNFTDASTNTPTSWLWQFGDGASDTVQNPTHIYAYVGTYTVTLTATNAYGSDDEVKVAYITVTAVTEYGAAVVENCDVDTGGLAVGLRVADVAIARDNRLGSVVIDASAELRVKDNSYTTLTNSGTFTSLAGDRSVWDVANFPNAHASDIDDATYTVHHNPALAGTYTVSNPVELRTIDLSSFTLNELAAVVGTLLADLGLA